MPEVTLQELVTGQSGDSTLGEGFNAYKMFKNCYETHIGPIESCRALLDFGCGWGRTIRFSLKDLHPDKLLGIDQDEKVIRACRNTNKWCRFTLIEPDAPVSLPKESLDLIYL
jgi:trans-aconitate methyltransferase